MGGQACVLYGAAEFSRDTDLALLASAENLARFGDALDHLQAKCIAVPPFDQSFLEMGLAVHFRCQREDVKGMRIDVMSKMRGVDAFEVLWDRRTTIETEEGPIELLSLPDLVKAKKTQRDKDWPMISRLVEANYFTNCHRAGPEQVEFWFCELRTPALLVDLSRQFPDVCERLRARRPLLSHAHHGEQETIRRALRDEEEHERAVDRAYWQPLREALQRMRRQNKPDGKARADG